MIEKMSTRDKGLLLQAIQVFGTRVKLAKAMGISERKLRFMVAGQRKLWLGRTIPIRMTPPERHLLRRLIHESTH